MAILKDRLQTEEVVRRSAPERPDGHESRQPLWPDSDEIIAWTDHEGPPRPEQPHRSYRAMRWLAAGWVIVLASLVAFEPPPNDPTAPVPWYGTVLVALFFPAFILTVLGLIGAKRWALPVSGLAGALGLAVSIGCAVTDHHPSWWWSYELTIFPVLLVLTWLAAREKPARRPSPSFV
jgi:peptidoglycan/LPS O-acetylase OafA/YrhL